MVQRVMVSSTKKSLRVLLADKWYGAALDSGLADKTGKWIKVEIITGETGPWINKWALIEETQAPVQTYDEQYLVWEEEESNRNYLQEIAK